MRRVLAFGGWVVAGLVVMVAAQRPPAPAGSVRCRELILEDKRGTERLAARCDDEGAVTLKIRDHRGTVRLALGVRSSESDDVFSQRDWVPVVTVCNSKGQPSAALVGTDAGVYLLGYKDGRNKPAHSLDLSVWGAVQVDSKPVDFDRLP